MLVMLNFWLLKNKSQKLEEQSKIINQQPKTILLTEKQVLYRTSKNFS